jgi:hypothetical protein
LTEAGRVIAWTTVQRITNLELTTDEVKQWCSQYDQWVTHILNDANCIIPHGEDIVLQDWNDYPIANYPDFIDEFDNVVSDDRVPKEDDNFTPDVFDDHTYFRTEITLPRGRGDQEDDEFTKVTKRLRNKEGRPIGTAHDNPLLDTREYKVEFLDGHRESLSANVIAQHMFSQMDEEGHQHLLLDNTMDFRRNDTVIDNKDPFVEMGNGVRHQRYMTQGWQLLCQWKDGSTDWVALLKT